ncbi:unnamed protein product [Orchesella dallaii]|uniref:Uncharacterized protein n=1 Tax=Orchesella dallaii TaxID=48710 RepID=A0ABP1RJE1_9HEXA
MGRDRNPYHKSIAPKKELSGAAKVIRRKEKALKAKKDAIVAARFFKINAKKKDAVAGSTTIQENHELLSSSEYSPSVEALDEAMSPAGTRCDVAAPTPTSRSICTAVASCDSLQTDARMSTSVLTLPSIEIEGEDFDPSDPSSWFIPLTSNQHAVLICHPSS